MATSVVQSGLIYFTYFRDGKRKKFKTGVKLKDKNTRDGMRMLASIEGKIDTIVADYKRKHGEKPSANYVWEMFNMDLPKASDTLGGNIQNFLDHKKGELKYASYKDYISLKNSLEDFIMYRGGDIPLTELTNVHIIKFNEYLGVVRKLNDRTNKKRISTLREYLRWLRMQGIYSVPERVIKAKINSSDYPTTKVTLESDELKDLYAYTFKDDKYNKVKDAFIFMCATSFRFSDLITFSEAHVKGNYIVKTAIKTMKGNATYTIPITPTINTIMLKYSFNFNFYTNQAFNRLLKELLKEYSDDTKKLKSEIDIRKVVLGKEVFEKKEKWKCISSHNGRRTFITLALENGIPTNKIINMTAHKRVTTLNEYINPNTKSPEAVQISFV